MNFFYQPDLSQGALYLTPEESHHAVKVLRLNEQDEIALTDGKGNRYKARITSAHPVNCGFEILETHFTPEDKFQIHLAIAPTKNIDRTEWFVEKSIEFGIHQISFIQCSNSERKTLNLERMEKIAVSALKQSQQTRIPKLNPLIGYNKILTQPADQKFIAAVDSSNPHHLHSLATPSKSYLILIGPEGDFSEDELRRAGEHHFTKVSLGPHRLRTETAALAACHIFHIINIIS